MRLGEARGPKFLIYHDLAAHCGGDEKQARKAFRRQLQHMLRRGFRFADMRDFLSGADLSAKDVIVTFDDGFVSVGRCAMPVLREVGALPTVFLITGFVGRTGHDVLNRKGYSTSYMTWDDILLLQREGVTFGAHTVSHYSLDQSDEEAMKAQIHGSTEMLRSRGVEPQLFSYPYGRHDDRVKDAVRKAGFAAAFSVAKGGRDRFDLRRRFLNGTEGDLQLRLFLSNNFFTYFNVLTAPIPRRFKRHVRPVEEWRQGPSRFGISDWQWPSEIADLAPGVIRRSPG